MPEIRLENLIKRYGAVQVLHGIDLSMAENEFTALVGPWLWKIYDPADDCWVGNGL